MRVDSLAVLVPLEEFLPLFFLWVLFLDSFFLLVVSRNFFLESPSIDGSASVEFFVASLSPHRQEDQYPSTYCLGHVQHTGNYVNLAASCGFAGNAFEGWTGRDVPWLM